MKDFDKYQERSKAIAESARKSGDGLGHTIAWLMILVGVVITGIQTHSLAYDGMKGSILYQDWLDIAAWLPVIILEGTAISLTLGRLYFFKSTAQRNLGHFASFGVWGCLAFNTVAKFSASTVGGMAAPLTFYARYILPLVIVALPYLWKALIDRHPDSLERIAALETEAAYDEQWRAVEREQNTKLVQAYREAAESPQVKEAINNLMKKAAITRAAQITGMVDMHDTEQAAQKLTDEQRRLQAASHIDPQSAPKGGYINGIAGGGQSKNP